MSSPQTNIEKQKRWHRGPLVGMAGVLVFVGLMFLWLTGTFGPDEPDAPVATEQGGAPTADGFIPETQVVPVAPVVPAEPAESAVPAEPAAPANN